MAQPRAAHSCNRTGNRGYTNQTVPAVEWHTGGFDERATPIRFVFLRYRCSHYVVYGCWPSFLARATTWPKRWPSANRPGRQRSKLEVNPLQSCLILEFEENSVPVQAISFEATGAPTEFGWSQCGVRVKDATTTCGTSPGMRGLLPSR